MLDYYELNEYKNIIKCLLNKTPTSNYSDDFKEFETHLDINRFMVEIMYNSKPELEFTEEALQDDIKSFNESHNADISEYSFYNRQWIRVILGKIRISHDFWSQVKSIFENENSKSTYENKDYYPLFQLLSILYKKYGYEDSRHWIISKITFEKIKRTYEQSAFNPTQLSDLEKILKFKTLDDQYFFFYNTSLFDSTKIASYLWTKLCFDKTIVNDTKRINLWLSHLENLGFPKYFIDTLPKALKKRFISASIEILENEKDLISTDIESEKKKIIFDSIRNGHTLDTYINLDTSQIKISHSEPFIMWYQFITSHPFLIYNLNRQECRIDCEILIHALLFTSDSKIFTEHVKYLLKLSETRVYIFYLLIHIFTEEIPERCIYFLDNKEYGLVFFCILLHQYINKHYQPSIDKKFIEQATFKLINLYMTKCIKEANPNNINLLLMYIIKLYYLVDKRKDDDFKKRIYIKIQELLQPIFIDLKEREKLLLSYEKNKEVVFHDYEGSINIYTFVYLFTLLDVFSNLINSDFVNTIYQKLISVYYNNILDNEKLYCTNEYSQIEEFAWDKFVIFLIRNNRFQEFSDKINAVFDYTDVSEENAYKKNRLIADKIRIHLKILCLAYNKINRKKYSEIFCLLQNKIFDLLMKCFSDSHESKSIYIFSSYYESNFNGNNTEIFPLIMSVVNDFSKEKRDVILNKIINRTDITLFFKAYNMLTREDDKILFSNFIESNDFATKINEIYSIPNFIQTLISVLNSHLDDDLEKTMLQKLEEIIKSKQKNGFANDLTYNFYLLKLFSLYKNKDEESLKTFVINFNTPEVYKDAVQYVNNQKLYYLALLNLEQENYNSAYDKLQKLVTSKNSNIEYNAHYFYVKFLVENSSTKKEKNYDSILQDLTTFEKSLSEETDLPDNVIELIQYTKLSIYHETKEYNAEKLLFLSLEKRYQQDLEFATLLINDSIEQKDYDAAFNYFNAISEEYKKEKEYKELSEIVSNKETIDSLSNSYLKILGLSSEKRFQVLPHRINAFTDNSGNFIMGELVFVLKKILDKQDAVKEISKLSEDRITDILQICLSSRLSMLGYQCSSQERCGSSQSGKSAGELDLVLDFEYSSITIEAVIFNGSKIGNISKHILKTFSYNSSKKYLFDVIYYKGVNGKFDENWEKVIKKIREINYPNNYEVQNTENEHQLEIQNNKSIHILKVKHNNELSFYHIMINLSYADKDIGNEGNK